MKRNLLFGAIVLLAASLGAADSNPKDEITMAARKLGEKPNYSWKTTVVVPDDAQFKPGPTEGKTEKDGFTHVTMSFGDNSREAVLKGDKGVVTNQEGEWQSVADLENTEGRGRFLARMVRTFKAPAAQAAELAGAVKNLKKEGDVYSGDFTDEGAKAQFKIAPATNAKGSVKFWLKDGALAKYEFKLKGTVEFNGNEVEVDRATTVEIKDVGTTKVNVPEAAKKKLS
jgi:hypothetical protein